MPHARPTDAALAAAGRKPTDEWAFLLPPGWARFPTGPGRGRELADVIERVVARTLPTDLPTDLPTAEAGSHRQLLRDSLHRAFGDAGAGAVYLPTERLAGMEVPASLVEVELFGDVGRAPADVALDLVGEGAEPPTPVDLDGRPGARVVSTVHDAGRAQGRAAVSTRQVTYVVCRDEVDGEWLALSFSTTWTTPGTEQLAEVLVEFFDAAMSTFRWTGPGVEPDPGLPERTVLGSA